MTLSGRDTNRQYGWVAWLIKSTSELTVIDPVIRRCGLGWVELIVWNRLESDLQVAIFIPAGVVLLGKFFHGHMKGGVVLRAHPALRLGQLAPDPEPPHSDVHTIVFGRRD